MKQNKKLWWIFLILGIADICVIGSLTFDIVYIVKTVRNTIDYTTHNAYVLMVVLTGVAFLTFTLAHIFATHKLFYKQQFNKNAVTTQFLAGGFYLGGLVTTLIAFFFTPKETSLMLVIAQIAYLLSGVVTCFAYKEAELI